MAHPAYHSKRRMRHTYGGEVADIATELGFTLMKWQRRALNVLLEYSPAGWRFPVAACSVPRQSGKSVLMLMIIAWWCRKWPGQTVVLVAQDRRAAARRLESLSRWCLKAGWKVDYYRGAGQERLMFHHDDGDMSEAFIVSSTRSGGHGESIDLALLDEGWSLPRFVVDSIVPAQIARPNSFRLTISTAGDEDSDLWNELCVQGREAVDDPDARLGFVEYAAPPGIDLFDSRNWSKWMPALGETTTVQNIVDASADLGGVGAPQWLRAFGNIATRSDASLFEVAWVETAVQAPVPKAPPRVVFGIDVFSGPDAGSLVAAWIDPHDRLFGVVIERRIGVKPAAWLPAALERELRIRPRSTVMIGVGPVITVKADLEHVTQRCNSELIDLNTTGVAGAAMRLYEHMRDGTIAVADLESVFEAAALAARAKSTGDRWRFDRAVLIDQSPLIALSLAADRAWVERLQPKVAIY